MEMFHNGHAKFTSTTLAQLGSMGVGVQLYFTLLKSLAIIFFLMAVCHTPAFIFNVQGNNGHALTGSKQSIWTILSLANQGFDRDLVEFGGCRNSELPYEAQNKLQVDCTGDTQVVFGNDYYSSSISGLITFGETMAGIVFIFGFIYCFRLLTKLEEKVDDENAEPEDYAVYVRNLPRDVTREDLVKHFSSLYQLKSKQTYYPLFLSTNGLMVYRFFHRFFLWLIFLGPLLGYVLVQVTGDANMSAIGTLGFPFFFSVLSVIITKVKDQGKGEERIPPAEEYDELRKERLKYLKNRKLRSKKAKYQVASVDENGDLPYDKGKDPKVSELVKRASEASE